MVNRLYFFNKKLGRKTFFSFNYDETKLHHISLVEFDELVKRVCIFFFKSVLFKTNSIYSCTNYIERIPWEKHPNKQQIL